MKTNNPPDLSGWSGLYEAAGQIKELAPWTFMEETDIFGVRDPQTGAIGFVSVMGMRGEHFAVAVYPDIRTLAAFWKVQDGDDPTDAESILEMPQIQASFEDRDFVEKDDLKVIRALGLKFRGDSGWPLFRSYRPGYIPWFLEPEEIRLLTQTLEQTLDVASRLRTNRRLFPGNRTMYLVHTTTKTPPEKIWKDEIVEIKFPAEEPATPYSDEATFSALSKFPLTKNIIETDVFVSFTRVGPKGTRPENPYLLLVVDSASRFILGLDLLTVGNSPGEMRLKAGAQLFQLLLKARIRPTEIRLKSKPLGEVIRPACERCGIRLRVTSYVPVLEEIKRDFSESFLGRSGPRMGS